MAVIENEKGEEQKKQDTTGPETDTVISSSSKTEDGDKDLKDKGVVEMENVEEKKDEEKTVEEEKVEESEDKNEIEEEQLEVVEENDKMNEGEGKDGEIKDVETDGQGQVEIENKMKYEEEIEEVKSIEEDVVEDEEIKDDVENKENLKDKGKKKKKKKKKNKNRKQKEEKTVEEKSVLVDDGPEIEYVPEDFSKLSGDPNYASFAKIFEAFKLADAVPAKIKEEIKAEEKVVAPKVQERDPIFEEDEDDEDMEKNNDEPKKSKKKMKRESRLTVAQLKQLVPRPDVVEMHDVNAKDPKLLVHLKAYRNTVPVPRHWCFKRKYLQGKRGFVKPPFELPEFIKNTGIMEMRAAMQEKEDAKTMKSKQRAKVRPKLGKIDIDYQKLHDAFFKYQTKPKMTIHGDLYYEGKEFETKLKEKKPGDLSDDLRTALGMPVGPAVFYAVLYIYECYKTMKDIGKHLIPPPWLIAMQRYGPPPSYPSLKIPGLNAAIPEGASFGYHAGGWGKPPVDETGKPLYGDVFGVLPHEAPIVIEDQDIDRTPWGELESDEESEESEEEEEEEEEDRTGLVTPGDAGLITPSGMSSVPAGLETPDIIELRKRKEIEDMMEAGNETPALYTVLAEKKANVGAAMMGSAHVYDMNVGGGRKTTGEGVEIALDPSELELDPAAMSAKYDETIKERDIGKGKEDLSDMVAEHAAKKKRKKPTDSGKASKKYKDFKF
eukprot:gene20419-22432_t